MNNQLNPLFRNILNAAAPAPRECAECKVREGHHWSGCSQFGLPPAPRECAECKILLSVIAGTGHAHDCSQFVTRMPVPYNADGFYRAPRVAAIGNGLFVRVGTGRKTRRAA